MPLPLLALLGLIGGGTAAAGAAIGAARRSGQKRNPLEEALDAQVIDDGPQGAFMSALEAIGRPGHAVNDILVGNFEGAGRQLVDLGGDIVDSVLPGDWISPISRRMDKVDFSDVLGGMEPGLGKTAVDVIGGIATDPTNLIPGAVVGKGLAKGAGLVKAGVEALPESLATSLKDTAFAGKEMLGWLNPTDAVKQGLAAAKGLRGRATKTGFDEAERIMSTLPENLQVMVGDVIDNLKHGPDGVSLLKEDVGRAAGAIEPIDQQIATLRNRLAEHPEFAQLDEASKAQVGQAIEDSIRLAHTQFLDDIKHGALANPGVDVSNASPRNYLQRLFEFPDDGETAMKGSLSDAQKSRKLRDEASLASFLNDPANKGVAYERNAYKRLLTRSGQQGRMLEKASIAKQVLGDRFENLVDGVYKTSATGAKVYDKSVTAAFDEAIDAMAKVDPDSARVLANAYHGLKARHPVLEALAKANRFFKPAAVYGVVIPKMGSIVRNDLGTSWQIMSTQGLKAAGKNLARTPRRLWDAINDGTVKAFGLKRVKPGELTRDIDLIEQAHKAARGSEQAVIDFLMKAKRADLAEAVRHGVLDGFVSMEEIMAKTASSSWWKKKAFDLYNAPSAVFQGVEQRARLGNFMDQYRAHGNGAKAAQDVREALLDYTVGSTKNRTLRDIIPFAAFLTGSVKQQSKFLATTPGAAGALSRALEQGPDQQVYPYMEGRLNIPIGKDTEGNSQFISGFGLPFEALQSVPNPSADLGSFGRQAEQSIVGSMQPLLKSAFGAVAGEDPYFGTPFGSYDKAPVIGQSGEFGRTYNKLAGTGMLQPIDTPLRMVDDALDPRHSPLTKALDLLTGANVVSVDPDRALQQRLQATLETNPQVAQHRSFYDRSGDPETQALLEAYNAVKARVKAKRVAAEQAQPHDPGTL